MALQVCNRANRQTDRQTDTQTDTQTRTDARDHDTFRVVYDSREI